MYRFIVTLLFISSIFLLSTIPFIHGRGQINLYLKLLLYVITILGLYMSTLFGNISQRKLFVALNLSLLFIIILMHTFNFWIG